MFLGMYLYPYSDMSSTDCLKQDELKKGLEGILQMS